MEYEKLARMLDLPNGEGWSKVIELFKKAKALKHPEDAMLFYEECPSFLKGFVMERWEELVNEIIASGKLSDLSTLYELYCPESAESAVKKKMGQLVQEKIKLLKEGKKFSGWELRELFWNCPRSMRPELVVLLAEGDLVSNIPDYR